MNTYNVYYEKKTVVRSTTTLTYQEIIDLAEKNQPSYCSVDEVYDVHNGKAIHPSREERVTARIKDDLATEQPLGI